MRSMYYIKCFYIASYAWDLYSIPSGIILEQQDGVFSLPNTSKRREIIFTWLNTLVQEIAIDPISLYLEQLEV